MLPDADTLCGLIRRLNWTWRSAQASRECLRSTTVGGAALRCVCVCHYILLTRLAGFLFLFFESGLFVRVYHSGLLLICFSFLTFSVWHFDTRSDHSFSRFLRFTAPQILFFSLFVFIASTGCPWGCARCRKCACRSRREGSQVRKKETTCFRTFLLPATVWEKWHVLDVFAQIMLERS